MENGRLFRLMAKLGSVGSRPNHSGGGPNDHSYENGDRFLVRMFSNFLFRQIDENGQPWLQISHIVAALNKVSEFWELPLFLKSKKRSAYFFSSKFLIFSSLKSSARISLFYFFYLDSDNCYGISILSRPEIILTRKI